MRGSLDPGSILIRVRLRQGAVVSASIRSDRPLSLAGRLAGRPLSEAIEAVSLLHAVCGQSHAAALRFAAASAMDRTIDAEERCRWLVRLAAERIGEHARELFAERPDASLVEPVRTLLATAHAAMRSETIAAESVAAMAEAVDLIAPEPDPSGAFPDTAVCAVDALTSADDALVIAALAADVGFEALPSLAYRQPEVGPAARAGVSAAVPGATRAARRREIVAALALLSHRSSMPDEPEWSGFVVANKMHENKGFAAVESPRGRLYYLVTATADGRLADARVLAPTEWNFHPQGPFARALAGFRPVGDPVAAITGLAKFFCPCVALTTEVDAADA